MSPASVRESSANDAAPAFVELETENVILGACLSFDGITSQFVAQGVRAGHFYRHANQLIWRRLVEALEEAGPTAALLTVRMLLAKHGELDEVGTPYLFRLGDGIPRPRPDDVRAIARRLIECAIGRQTRELLAKFTGDLEAQPDLLTSGFFNRLQKAIEPLEAQLRGRTIPEHVSHISDVMEEVRAHLAAGPPSFIDTPWPTLNYLLGGGFAPAELIYLGSRPGFGKTAAALEIVRRAGKRGVASLVVSREMLKVALGLRMIAQEGSVDAMAMRRGRLSLDQTAAIEGAMAQLATLPIYLTHKIRTIDEIYDLVGVLSSEGALGVLVVDYLQLIKADPAVRERRLQVEAVSAGLKAITLDYQIPVICLSSLSRPSEGNKRPSLASLRESGNLEHDADTVMFLHRPDEMQPRTEMIVAKARNGKPGINEVFLRGEYLRFEEMAAGHGD